MCPRFGFLSDVDGLITQALLTGDFEGAVELCLHDNRMADSIILAIAGGAELLEKTQKKYFTRTHSKITKVKTNEKPRGATVSQFGLFCFFIDDVNFSSRS